MFGKRKRPKEETKDDPQKDVFDFDEFFKAIDTDDLWRILGGKEGIIWSRDLRTKWEGGKEVGFNVIKNEGFCFGF